MWPPELDAHVEETVAAIAKVQRDHEKKATPLQRVINRSTAFISRPWFVACLAVAMVIWMAGNVAVMQAGGHSLDPPPFVWLELAASSIAVLMAALILSTQRRDDQLADQRAALTLGLSVLSERKIAKIISLLEELRRDHPGITDRVDRVSESMAKSADPEAVLAAIEVQSEAPSAPELIGPPVAGEKAG